MIEIDKPEIHGGCFSPIVREGHAVICVKCGQIGETIAAYKTTYEKITKTTRNHQRGHPRGRHRGQQDK